MREYLAVLQNCPLFSGISADELLSLTACLGGKTITAEKGQPIFREGDPARWVGVVLSGQVQVVSEDYYGSRHILAHIGPGGLFGEAFACAEVDALPVSVTAVSPARVLLLDCSRIIHTCSSACSFHSRMLFNLLKVMATKNLVFHQKLQVLSQRTTREKLMTYLMAQAKARGSSTFSVPFDRQALADYLGVDRSGLSSEIGKLKKEGVLECTRSTFRLL